MSEGTPPRPPSSHSGMAAAVASATTLSLPVDSAAEAVPALGSVIADKYRIEELIARGGMGAVYLATHLVSGKRVALKWMLPVLGQMAGAKERFVREACATARIDHPNVVDIYDVGNDHGSVYLVMELLLGETLAEFLERSPRVGAAQVVSLIMPALRGVACAHAHHVIHRDLKPENIFLCRSPDGEPREPKVLDFGISKITSGEGARELSLTCSGAVMGTPYYMSPEQVRGAKDVDERGDIYAFGVILYEMLTGQRPYDAETYNQLILKIATENPPPILELNPQLDTRLVAVIERAMAREPSQRFASIEALALSLEPFAAGALFRASSVRTPVAADSGEHAGARPFAIARRPLRSKLVALGIALGSVIAGLGYWQLSRGRETAQAEGRIELRERSGGQDARAEEASETSSTTTDGRGQATAETTLSAATGGGQEQPARGAARLPKDAALEPAAATGPRGRAGTARGLRESNVDGSKSGARKAKARPLEQSADKPAVTAPATPTSGKLPDDWDDRLQAKPARSGAATSSPAGPIDLNDLR